MYVWYRFEEKVNNNLRIMLIKDWLHFTLPKFTHSYCKLESKWSLRLYCIPLACLCASKTGTFSKGNCELALTAWSHSPEIFVCFFPPLHKQYKEVDRSERGLCEKIIKSFRECQESIAQHCQHSGVLQAIIRWHGGVRHAWQLIPAWSPRGKKTTKSGLHEMSSKVGEHMYRTRFFQGSASFSQMALFWWEVSLPFD